MSKHTPGPWELVPQSNGGGWMLAHVTQSASQMSPVKMRLVAHVLARGTSFAEDSANGDLLAAAPDLLEVLGEIAKGGWSDVIEPVALARAALTKAGFSDEGKT